MIKIYSTKTCHWCKIAQEYFTKKGLTFEVFDVTTDKVRRQEMVDAGYSSVPVIKIGENTIVGWNKDRVETLLTQTV